jgi:hypothetical protein
LEAQKDGSGEVAWVDVYGDARANVADGCFSAAEQMLLVFLLQHLIMIAWLLLFWSIHEPIKL